VSKVARHIYNNQSSFPVELYAKSDSWTKKNDKLFSMFEDVDEEEDEPSSGQTKTTVDTKVASCTFGDIEDNNKLTGFLLWPYIYGHFLG
jgi:hypothetical protein